MKISKITSLTKHLNGTLPLPAGAVPLAAIGITGYVCLMPNGRWINWMGGVIKSLPNDVQKEVMGILVEEMGGTAQKMADNLEVSRRTVEAWRSGAAKLPIVAAYNIASILG